MTDKVLEAKDPYFKQINAFQLGSQCTAFGITHKYGLTCLCLDGFLCLIHTEEFLAGNVNDLLKTKIPCQTLACNEEIIVVGFFDNVVIYSYPGVIQDVPKPLHNVKAKSNVKKLHFNPTDNSMIAILSEDGNLLLTKFNMSGTGFQNWVYDNTRIISFCFSPKGKQLCVGHESGDLTQLKLDLTVAKKIKGPEGGKPVSLLWISTTQFLTLMLTDDNNDINLVQIDLHKAPAPPTYVNFGDAFISEAVDANSQACFCINNEAIVCSSSTSTEVVVLVKSENGNWRVADDIEDRRRAALPLDTYAVGAALYYNYRHKVSFSESETYDEMPVYIVGSREGKFSCFNFVNKGGLGDHVNLRENLSILSWQSGQIQSQGGSASASLPPATFNFTSQASQGQQQPPSLTFGLPTQSTPPSLSKPGSQDSTLLSLLSSPTTKTVFVTPPQFSSTPTHIFQPPPPQPIAPLGQPLGQNISVIKPLPATPFTPFAGSMLGLNTTSPASAGQKLGESVLQRPAIGGSHIGIDKKEPSGKVLNQVREFEKRMETHRKTCSAHNLKFKSEEEQLGADIEDKLLLRIRQVEDFVEKVQHATKIQKIQMESAIQKNLDQYSQITYAKSLEERNSDPKFLNLLKAKPMDAATKKKFRTLQNDVNYIQQQIQECRRHFYFAKCPPLKTQTASKYILTTIDNHEMAITNLKEECERMKEQLKLNSSHEVDDLDLRLRRTTLNEPKIKSSDLDELKSFLRRKNFVKVKASDKPDYTFANGVVTHREGITEGTKLTTTLPPLPRMTRTSNMSTQTDAVTMELEKIRVTTQRIDTAPKPSAIVNPPLTKPVSDTFAFPSLSGSLSNTKPFDSTSAFTQSSTAFAPTRPQPQVGISRISSDFQTVQPTSVIASTGLQAGAGSTTDSRVTPATATSTSTPPSSMYEPITPTSTESKTSPNAGPFFSFKPAIPATVSASAPAMAFPKPTFGGGSFSFGSDSNTASGVNESAGTFVFKPESTAASISTNPEPTETTATATGRALDLTGFGGLSFGSTSAESKPKASDSVSRTPATTAASPPPPSTSPPETSIPKTDTATSGGSALFGLPSSTTVTAFGSPAGVHSPFLSTPTSTPSPPTTSTSGPTPGDSVTLPSFSFKLGDSSDATTKSTSSNPFVSSPFSFNAGASLGTAQVGSDTASKSGSTGLGFGLGFGAPSETTAPESPPTSTSPQAAQSPISFASLTTGVTSPDSKLTAGAAQPFGTPPAASAFLFKPTAPAATTTGTGLLGSSLFSSPTTTSSIFGTSQASPFGQTSQSTTSLFGGAAAVTSDASNKSPFGASVFGGSPFGSGTSAFSGSTPSTGSIFGSALTQPSSFGAFGQQSSGSIFGSGLGDSKPAPTFGGPAVFGGSTFGSSPVTTFASTMASPSSGSIFGASVTQSATFGQIAQTQPTAFGSPGTQDSAQNSGFGGGGSVFGGSPFGATSAFGSTSPSGGGSIFGGGAPQGAGFGQFGQQSPTTGFGAPAAQEQKPASFGGSSFSSWR